MLLWGVLWIWYYTGCLEYDLVLLNETSSISMFIVISVLIGAMGKSAQILFHVWLADAMEGPTPVSALIHAATLVTAGIYLMVRLGPFMAGSDLIILVGCLTAFMAGVFGFFQADLKRVIAFSTCSQLGYLLFNLFSFLSSYPYIRISIKWVHSWVFLVHLYNLNRNYNNAFLYSNALEFYCCNSIEIVEDLNTSHLNSNNSAKKLSTINVSELEVSINRRMPTAWL